MSMRLKAHEIEGICHLGLYSWCERQDPPLEPDDVSRALCDMALLVAKLRGDDDA